MAGISLKYEGRGQAAAAFAQHRDPIAIAATGAVKDAAQILLKDARANIAAAGFSHRWQMGFRVRTFPARGVSIDAQLQGFHRIGFANIFERGGTIRPKQKKLLWVPLPDAPKKIGGQRLTPKLYIEQIGPLHSINRPGRAPLLAGYIVAGRKATVAQLRAGSRRASQGRAGGRRRGRRALPVISVPIFVGVPSARIARRFNITPIYDRIRGQIADLYVKRLAQGDNA